jgi:hypothetical protein
MKPEAERDSGYIKDQFKQAGQSAAIEGGLLLMGGIVGKYGAKGVKALADKVKQYEVDPNVASAFGVGSIKKKAVDPLEIGINEALQDGKFLKEYDSSVAADMVEKAKNATAGSTRANALMNAAVPEGTKVGIRLNLNSTIPDMPKGLDKLQTLHKGSFSGTALSYLPFATVKNVTFNVSQKGRTAIASRIKGIDTPEAKAKYPAMSVDGEYVPNKNLLDEGGDLAEISLNPGAHHLFIDLKTGQAVKGAKEVTVIGDRAYARGVEYWKKAEAPAPLPTQTGVDIPSDVRYKFKEGGIAMKDDMNMGYALGGEVDAIDPVSGNEIPPGSTAKEVRDDIPTMLSEGEYVVPADVLKFYGLRFFEDLRDNAKVEMAELEEEGRIGGQPTPEGDDLTEDEMRLLGEVMGMAEGGMTPMQPQPPQPMMMGQQMPPPKPQPTEYNKPVGFNTGGMTDAFGNPIGPTVDPVKPPEKLLQDIDPTSTNIYGIDKEGTGTSSPTNLAQEDIGVKTPTDQIGTGDKSGMKSVFYFHEDGRRIQVLMLNGKPISSVPADFNEFKEDTPENRTEIVQETPDPTDDISGGVGQTKSAGGSGSDDDDRKVQAKKLETLKTNKEKKRVQDFNNLLDPKSDTWKADTDGSKLLEEYRKAKVGQGIAMVLPGIGLPASAIAKKTLNNIEEAYLKKAKELGISPEEAQKTLDGITGAQAIKEGITKPFEGKEMGEAMSDMFGSGFYDAYETKYEVSDYIGMSDSISAEGVQGFTKDPVTKALSGNLDVKQQQHFDNAVDRGDSAIANHFSLVATSNAAKDDFAINNADAIKEIQDLKAAGKTSEAATKTAALKNAGHKFGNMTLGSSSMDEVIELGSSALTAKNLGKAKKEDKFFGKTVATTDNNGNKNNSPITSTSSGSSSSGSSSGGTKTYSSLAAAAADGKHGQAVSINGKVQKVAFADKDYDKKMQQKSNQAKSSGGGGGGGSSSGGGGGGGGSSPSASSSASGCVIATHAVASGAFQRDDKANAVEWCKKTLHDKWWGETMRKGYRYLGRKHIANGTAETVYKEFKECIEWANGKRPFTIKVASRYYYRAIQTFLVGLFVKEEV